MSGGKSSREVERSQDGVREMRRLEKRIVVQEMTANRCVVWCHILRREEVNKSDGENVMRQVDLSTKMQ